MVRGRKGVGVAEPDQRAMLRAMNQLHRCFQDHRARAFSADKRAGEVEAILGQQFIEVVARHATRNSWESFTNPIAAAISERQQSRGDLTAPGLLTRKALDRSGTYRESRAVVQEDVQLFDVID